MCHTGLPSTLNKQNAVQPPAGHHEDFVLRYMKCLGLDPNEMDKLPEVLRKLGTNAL